MKAVFSISALFFVVGMAFAQETPVLPDLAPRQVEITGELAISFPSLRRQPLIGFNPPPAVPGIPDSRRPYTGQYKQSGADLPASPLSPPDPPAVSAFASRTAQSGRITLQAGRYLDRFVDADVELYVDDAQSITTSVTYFGTDGHDATPTGGSTERDLFSSDVRWRRTAGPGIMDIRAGLTRNSWNLVGATPVPGSFSLPSPERTASAVRFSAGWGSRIGTRLPFDATLSWMSSEVETDIFDPTVRDDPSTDRHENRLVGRGHLSLLLSEWVFSVSGTGALSGLDESGSVSLGTTRDADARLTVASPRGRRLELELGATLLAFDSDPQRAGSIARSESYLVPSGRLTFWLNESTSVFAGSAPGLVRHSSLSLLDANPFTRDEPIILPDLYSIRGFAGLLHTARLTEWEVRAGFDRAPEFGYYTLSPTPLAGYSAGYYDRRFDELDRFYVESSFALILTPSFHSGISATLQSTELDATGRSAPFMSPVSIRPWIQARGFGGRLDFSSELLFEASRDRDETGGLETDDYWRLAVQTRYYLRPGFAVTAGLRHAFSEPDFWYGRPLEDSAVHAGVGWRW